MLAGWKT